MLILVPAPQVLLPRASTLSLLRAHRHSIRKVRLLVYDEWNRWSSRHLDVDEGVGLEPDAEDDDEEEFDEDGFLVVPVGEDCLRSSCWGDLSQELADGDYPILSSMTLLWLGALPHDSWSCQRFARDLATARPLLAFHCDQCH